MISLASRKILIQLILIGILITMYDVMLHSLFSIMHITFEWFELGLEELIEHIFHTNRQQSQIIVFYLMWLIAFYGFYRIWRALPGFYSRYKEQLFTAGMCYKSYLSSYWAEQSSIQKIKWVTSLTVSISCLAFFAFS
jgi:hypothetical protein